jgi:hypothetical protein
VKLSIKSQEDLWAGLLFVGFGLVAIFIARDYPYGSAMRMGPGYFPTWLGGLMTLIGMIIIFRSTRIQGEGISGWAWRPLITLCLAFVTYGLSMEYGLGFIPSIALVVIISSFAIPGFRPLELALLTTVLVLGTTALFLWGLELPYPKFWWSY